jgi:hypothetical protein
MKKLFALTFVTLTFALATVSCGGSKSESAADSTVIDTVAVDSTTTIDTVVKDSATKVELETAK